MPYDGYRTLTVRVDDGVALVTIDHPPVNLADQEVAADLDRFSTAVRTDEDVRVIVLESADPDFFLAHGDMSLALDPGLQELLAQAGTDTPNPGQALHERFRTLPQVTIGKLAGRARGGGAEFLLALDMRFAATGRAWLGLPEVSLGMIPGGGGTQYLPRLTGRARALEIILGSDGFDAELAERYGWVNRALPAAELDGFVERLARRIASYPAAAVAAARAAVDAAHLPVPEGLLVENELIQQVFFTPETTRRVKDALAAGAQTREGELDLEGLLAGSR
ncbi:enoyl-CoA hydratase/isomerase family protein [Kitasatospora sp. NPDC057223]|uniref:enoyl-CoA hydratase/isomerase family protein n=1 Tax=Kitasatospora sp. NPDC057223 TaxID=3346055 RepID=UPI003637C56A